MVLVWEAKPYLAVIKKVAGANEGALYVSGNPHPRGALKGWVGLLYASAAWPEQYTPLSTASPQKAYGGCEPSGQRQTRSLNSSIVSIPGGGSGAGGLGLGVMRILGAGT